LAIKSLETGQKVKFPFMKQLLILFLLVAPILVRAGNEDESALVSFKRISLEEARSRAEQEGKLIFIHFTASWCMPCQLMSQTTYKDQKVASLLNDNFVSILADVEEPFGFDYKNKYNVNLLPTLLIMNFQGQILGRYEESLGVDRMVNLLGVYIKDNSRINKSYSSHKSLNEVKPNPKFSKPTGKKSVPQQNQEQANITTVVPTSIGLIKEEGTFRIEAKEEKLVNWVLQTNVFRFQAMALAEIERLSSNEDLKDKLFIQCLKSNDVLVYKVCIGSFESRQLANTLKDKCKAIGSEGWILKDLGSK
jgi:thiol-disulfide isomerase/thioredoxin